MLHHTTSNSSLSSFNDDKASTFSHDSEPAYSRTHTRRTSASSSSSTTSKSKAFLKKLLSFEPSADETLRGRTYKPNLAHQTRMM